MGENRGHLLPCTQHRYLAILHARWDLLGMEGKWELRWGEMHPFVVEKWQHLTRAERNLHKEVMHAVTISTEFVTKIHTLVCTVRILCALWGCSQEEKLLMLKADLCAVPKGVPWKPGGYWGAPLLLACCWCPLLPWAPHEPLPAEGQE